MLSIHWILAALALSATYLLLHHFQDLLFMKKNKKKKILPPGPKGRPILGNLLMLGKNPHQDLCKLSRIHGPIMSMRFGQVPRIIVSSSEAAEKFLKTNDQNFASRPCSEAAWYVSYGQRSLTFAPYGSYWRNMRKLCVLHLLSANKIISFQEMRRKEVDYLVKSLEKAASDHRAVDLSAMISCLSADMSCLMIFGKKYMDEDLDERGFREVVHEVLKYAAVPNVSDFFPWLSVLDLQGLRRKFKELSKVFDSFLERIIAEHIESGQDHKEVKDFVDILLEIMHSGESEAEFDLRHIKAVLLDMMIASMDTSATSVEWAISELIRNPEAMKKLQGEIGEKVGMNRTVEESDLEGLEYLEMVVKESLRLHPPGTLLLAHESIQECEVEGFHIQKKSRIIVNAWAIGRDPSAWPDPESFNPERFRNNDVDIRGHDFRLIPFGSGRRMCPGMQLGMTVFRFVLAQLVHCFDWKLAEDIQPHDLDMSEAFGLVTSRAQHLKVIPIYRLENESIGI